MLAQRLQRKVQQPRQRNQQPDPSKIGFQATTASCSVAHLQVIIAFCSHLSYLLEGHCTSNGMIGLCQKRKSYCIQYAFQERSLGSGTVVLRSADGITWK